MKPDDREPAATKPAPRRARRNALGEERPAFLLDFPDDPELEQLILAFEEGDFASVRRAAPELVKRTTDESVRRAALELRRRIDPDPLLVVLLLFTLSLFVIIVAWIYTRSE
jgi:hypothetical protein